VVFTYLKKNKPADASPTCG